MPWKNKPTQGAWLTVRWGSVGLIGASKSHQQACDWELQLGATEKTPLA